MSERQPMKQCKTCLTWKPLDEFHHKPSNRDKRTTVCKRCHYERHRKVVEANRERQNAYGRKYRQRPEVKEQRNDYQRRRRFLKRKAQERGAGIFTQESASLAKY